CRSFPYPAVYHHVLPPSPTRRSSDLYASYVGKGSSVVFPQRPAFDGLHFGLQHVDVYHPVIEGANRVGTLYIHGDLAGMYGRLGDRKSTRLNSSHVKISYAVFCLKKK